MRQLPVAPVLAVASGGLLALSLPPYDVEWLGWVAVAPALVAAQGRRTLEAVGVGLLAGVTCGLIHVGWRPGAAGVQYAWLPFLWLAMLVGLVAAAGAAADRWPGGAWVLFVASAGVAGEWLTTVSPLPLNLAVCQYRVLPVIQIASLTGIWGVSFLLWSLNAAVADAVHRRQLRSPPLGLAAGAVALAFILGAAELARSAGGPEVTVAAIQDFTPAETIGVDSEAPAEAEIPDREVLTREAAARGARLAVWSEGCLGDSFVPGAAIDPTVDLARELGITLVVGYTERARPKDFNCAAVVAPDGSVVGIHRKIHLFLGERQAVRPGAAATAFDTGLGRVGAEICFDTCYPDVTRRVVDAGAQLVAMPNFDPPTPRGILHRLHAALLPFRAVENRVAFVRADSNGLSQIIAPTGRIVAQGPLYAPAVLVANVPLGDGRGTLYTRLGDWVGWGCLGLLAGLGALAYRRSRSRKERKVQGME